MNKKKGSNELEVEPFEEVKKENKPYLDSKVLDRKKIDLLVNQLSEYLNYEDIFEIKKQINILNQQGKLLP